MASFHMASPIPPTLDPPCLLGDDDADTNTSIAATADDPAPKPTLPTTEATALRHAPATTTTTSEAAEDDEEEESVDAPFSRLPNLYGSYDPADARVRKPMPRIIHQTWKTTTIPAQWEASAAACRLWGQQPGWQYRLWTDADNRRLIATDFPWFLAQYDSYSEPVQRADAVRYFILYKHGGVYMDLDIVPKANFDALFTLYQHAEVAIVGTKQGNSMGLQRWSNCFMMSQPQASFWPLVWKHLQAPMQTHWWKPPLALFPYFNVLFRTGPGVICDALEEFSGPFATIPADLVQPGVEADVTPHTTPGAAVTLLTGESWQRGDAHFWRAIGSSWPYIVVTAVGVWVALTVYLVWRVRQMAARSATTSLSGLYATLQANQAQEVAAAE